MQGEPTAASYVGAPRARSEVAAVRPDARGGPPHGDAVERTALIHRMETADQPVIAVIAPPGFGTSTLLSQWARRRGGRLAWVACERIHDDVLFLWTALVAALALVEPLDAVHTALNADGLDQLGPHLADLLGSITQPVTIVLDHLESVSSRESQRLVAALAVALPPGWCLALGSREQLPTALANVRVQRGVLELGAADLAMSTAESAQMLRAVGLDLDDGEVHRLMRQTRGWPAVTYLAGLAIRSGEASAEADVSGNDRLIREYLHSEVLDPLPAAHRRLLLRTSILERVNGDLATAVTGSDGAGRLLQELHRRDGLVEASHSRGGWYRYHPLLRQLLRAELETESPHLVPELHARAAAWFGAAGEFEPAIDHADLAGDPELFAHLVLDAMQPVWASGDVATVELWMKRLDTRTTPSAHTPAMIAHGALIYALLGRAGDAERWAAVAEAMPDTGVLPDGSTVAATMAYLRANLSRQGPAAIRQDAATALEGLSATSPYRVTMVFAGGMSHLLEGHLDEADAGLAHAHELAVALGTSPVSAIIRAEQFLAAAARDDWETAQPLIQEAVGIVAGGPFEGYWTSALVFAAAAHAATRRGEPAEARVHLARAEQLRPLLTYALPVVSVQALLEMGRASLALLDPPAVREVLRQIAGIVQQRPQLGSLTDQADQLREQADELVVGPALGAPAITPAELRVIPLLPTRLTYAEIGAQLFVTHHTVKAHMTSLYRKLGVSSRSEAVDRLARLGLL